MKLSFTRFGLFAIASVAASAASAQSIDIWYNVTGNTAHSGTINATTGSTLNLTVYFQTTGFVAAGGLSQLGALLGIGSSTTSGTGASNTDGRLGIVGGPTYATNPVNFGSYDIQHGTAGGNGPADGTARSWGAFADTFTVSNMGTADGVIYSFYSVAVQVNASAGSTIAVPIWVDTFHTNPGPYSSYSYAGSTLVKPASYSANIVVGSGGPIRPPKPPLFGSGSNLPPTPPPSLPGVPEPATLAALGIGALAVIRRRK